MIYANSTAAPRQDLQGVVMQGRGVNKQNIGQLILPLYGVDHMNGHLVSIGIAGAELMRISDKIVAPGANIERITLSFDGQTYALAIRKEEVLIPDEIEKEYAEYFSTESVAAQTGEDRLELTHEYLVAAQIFNTTNFGSATNSAVAYTAANLATISFIADVYAAIERVRDKGEEPNTIVIPSLVYQRLRQATLVQNFVKGQLNAGKETNVNTILEAFRDEGITKVLIGRSRYNTAARGATPSFTKVWGNTYVWVGRTSDEMFSNYEGINTVEGVGATLFWKEYGAPWQVDTYRAEERESNVVRVKSSAVPYIANTNAGTLIATQYS